jgi:exonuclease VII small subunit
MTKQNTDLTKTLKELHTIVEWFEDQEEVDIEEGLKKVKDAAQLIKLSKGRLKEVENEFKEIEKEIEDLDQE